MTLTESASEHRARVLGHYATRVRRSRKGRSTFVVTERPNRYHVGPDPFRADAAPTDEVRLTGRTLAADADAWIRANDPDYDTHECTCSDLSEDRPVFISRTIWHVPAPGCEGPSSCTFSLDRKRDEQGDDIVKSRRLRACHCRPFPALLGTDARSFEELTPSDMASGRWRDRSRTRLPRARKGESFTTERVSHSSDTRYPVSDATVMWDASGALVTGGIDASGYWSGHRFVRRSVATRGANDARTEARAVKRASAARPDWADALDELTATLTPGDTEPVTVQGVRITTSAPDTTGRYRATLSFLDGTSRTIRTRTLAPIARALLA